MTPLQACGPSIAASSAIASGSAAFFGNLSRASVVLKAPKEIHLNDTEAARLKERWRAATTEAALGSVVVVGHGYEVDQLSVTAADAQLVEQYRMSKEDIASAFRVPLHLLGDLSRATFTNVDALQRSFYASGLSFYLDLIETAVGDFFGLPLNEYAEFDIEGAFMRPEFETRMEAFGKGIQGGVLAPNEARAMEHLPRVRGGDMVFLQRQMAPVDQIVEAAKNSGAAPAPSADDDGDIGNAGTKALAPRPGASRTLAAAIERRVKVRRRRAA